MAHTKHMVARARDHKTTKLPRIFGGKLCAMHTNDSICTNAMSGAFIGDTKNHLVFGGHESSCAVPNGGEHVHHGGVEESHGAWFVC